ncbi:YrhB domain-containing protein [Mucilaginibacter terrae]|uniref:Immunity protein 35 domain-containing protein n=1 Tax=Mucilaginibacter terrae TaxID=1955052 RepID=A0ABU3GVA1_9SPHI|nr:YrhB domain-containing protein [Mucilaginibacter terrae]MDT3403401.1 hypothetical protein [Mucilaginibacter terrae]
MKEPKSSLLPMLRFRTCLALQSQAAPRAFHLLPHFVRTFPKLQQNLRGPFLPHRPSVLPSFHPEAGRRQKNYKKQMPPLHSALIVCYRICIFTVQKTRMLTKKELQSALEADLNAEYQMINDSIVILDSDTIEADDYYVFFYQSNEFLQTNNFSSMLAGNAPVIVNKVTGERFVTGTAYPVEHYISIYENTL